MEREFKNVAVYLRKSRGESDKDLEKHKFVLENLCDRFKVEADEYKEIGSSDSIKLRPQMVELLENVKKGIYDAVFVVEVDRLSRGDMGEVDVIRKAFKRSKTIIQTPDKAYDLHNDLDDTFFTYKTMFAREEYKAIKRRLNDGKKIGAKKGDWTNGKPPFPYEYERYKEKFKRKGLVVNDEKLTVYRKVIDMALQGMSTSQIAIQMNQEKIKSPSGGMWNNVTVNRMLIDETHLGKIVSNKTKGDGHELKKEDSEKSTRLPKNEWVIVENCHEAVKTPQEHEKILALLSERRLVPPHARKGSYSLSGLVFCKECGHGLTYLTNTRGKFLKPCWYKDPLGNKCKNSGIRYEILEKLIIDDVIEKYNSQDIEKYDEDTYYLENLKKLKNEKENQIKKTEFAISRITDAYELGDYTREEWLKRKELRNAELNTVRNELFDIENRIKNFNSVSDEERRNNVKYFLDNIDNLSTPEERNSLFSTIISKVIWHRNGDDIELKIQYK
jgi:DNA invertase Pin-like site-specific DNA recombinase